MLTNQAIGALARSTEEKQVGLEEVSDFEADMSLSWVVLPSGADKTKPERWAKQQAKTLIKMHGEKPAPGAQDQLIHQLREAAETARSDLKSANAVLALTNVPPVGVDALGYIMVFDRDGDFDEPGYVERTNFDVHSTQIRGLRQFATATSRLGVGTRTWALRESVFYGAPTLVRAVDYYILLDDYPGRCLVLGAYWPNPEFDEFIEAQLEQMLATFKLSIVRAQPPSAPGSGHRGLA